MVNIEDLELEEGTIVLEPQSSYNKAIIGVSIDSKHIIYSYDLLLSILVEGGMSYEDAMDWLEYNTFRSLDYMDVEYRPIIIRSKEEE
jgi:hypothetical protein